MAPQYSRNCCQKLRKRQKLAEKFVRTTSYIDSWATWKEFHHSSLGTSVQMCTYTIFSACRYIALTAIVKVRVGCAKTVWNEQVCAHQKSYRKYIFQNIFEAIMHRRDCSCAPVLRFFSVASDGTTANRQIPSRIFGQFLPVWGRIASPVMYRFGRCSLLKNFAITTINSCYHKILHIS